MGVMLRAFRPEASRVQRLAVSLEPLSAARQILRR